MIVRVWRASTTPENAAAYRTHLEEHVFPTLRSIDGFAGAELLQRRTADDVEFLVATRWTSMQAVRRFAGDAFENAVVAPGARAVLSSYDEHVAHYEITAECEG